MNQCQQVLAYMRRHGSITQGEAYTLGIGRLSPRIGEIEKATGVIIPRSTVKVRKANGKDANVSRYYITPALSLSSTSTVTAAPDQGGLFDYPVSRESFDNSGKAIR